MAKTGAALRSTERPNKTPYTWSALGPRKPLAARPISCGRKSNEITAIPTLLEILELEGAVVTIDAMGCQTEIAAKIREKESGLYLAVKSNQEHLEEVSSPSSRSWMNRMNAANYPRHGMFTRLRRRRGTGGRSSVAARRCQCHRGCVTRKNGKI